MFKKCPNCGYSASVEAKTNEEAVRLAEDGELTVWCYKCDYHGPLPAEEQARIAKAG